LQVARAGRFSGAITLKGTVTPECETKKTDPNCGAEEIATALHNTDN
jgi:hypothetical protein